MTEILNYLPGVFLIYGVFLLQNATPGPNVLAVMGTSMSAGRQSGLAVSLGVASGTLTWSAASVLGLSAVIASFGQLLFFIKIGGACYLFYLAFRAFRAATADASYDLNPDRKELSLWGHFRKGYLLNLTNPKAALGWIAIVSLGLDAGSPLWVSIAIVVGTTALSLGVHVLYILAFSTQKMVGLYERARRPVQGLLGTLFAFAGYKLATAEID